MLKTKQENSPIYIVLGGSFNPPTLAHRDLALHACEAVELETRRHTAPLFVPSSDAYVRRKMSKMPHNGFLFSEQARADMCLALMDGYGGAVNDIEFGDNGRGNTYQTMRRLQDGTPDHEHMFLLGADKLKILPRWHDIEKFLSEFMIVVTARDGQPAVSMIDNDPLLSAYKSSFIVITEMNGKNANTSSTIARDTIAYNVNLDDVAAHCGYGVTKIIERELNADHAPDVSKSARTIK